MKLSQIDMPAMREALTQMPSGSKWEIVVPSAWGADVRTRMPPQRGCRVRSEADQRQVSRTFCNIDDAGFAPASSRQDPHVQ
jgi:hypothetical protein